MNNTILLSVVYGFILLSSSVSLATVLPLNNKLLPSNEGVLTYGGEFGQTIKVDGKRLVTSGTKLSASGAVIYFEFNESGWVEKQQILPTENSENVAFGQSISLKGDILVVGAPTTSSTGTNNAVYIYQLKGDLWHLTKRISEISINSTGFGEHVATNGKEVIFSAEDCRFDFITIGCVIIYEFSDDEFREKQVLKTGKLEANTQSRSDIVFEQSELYIGFPRALTSQSSLTGLVSSYKKIQDEWVFFDNILNSKGNRYDEFGHSIELVGGDLFIGAFGSDIAGLNNGAVFVFNYNEVENNWIETQVLTIEVAEENRSFGYDISSEKDMLIVSRKSGLRQIFADSVYFFKKQLDGWAEESEVINTYPDRFGYFGESIALSQNYLFIGEPFAGDDYLSGVMHEFYLSGNEWLHQQQIIPKKGLPLANFGEKVVADEQYLFISAPNEYFSNDTKGSVWIYEKNGTSYNFINKAVSSNSNDYFSYDIKSDNGRLVISAPWDSESGLSAGAVYILSELTDWQDEYKILPPNLNMASNFGLSVDLDDNQLAVGAPSEKLVGIESGAVYIYDQSNGDWENSSKVTSEVLTAGDGFGSNISLHGEHLFITSQGNKDISFGTGEVEIYLREGDSWRYLSRFTDLNENYIQIGDVVHVNDSLAAISGVTRENYLGVVFLLEFNGQSWDYIQNIYPSELQSNNGFGSSVLIKNEEIFVGTKHANDYGFVSGAVYRFSKTNNTWQQNAKLLAGDRLNSIKLGSSLSFVEDELCVGAPLESSRGLHSGAVYCENLDLIYSNGFE